MGESFQEAAEQRIVPILEEFSRLLSIPNSAEDRQGLVRSANFVREMLEKRGITAKLVERDGAVPLVLGRLDVGADRTVALYSHYDGQPAKEPNWLHEPWAPTLYSGKIEDGAVREELGDAGPNSRLYARSTSDDKAPSQALCSALDLLDEVGERASVNLVIVTEGEEECGSPNLASLLEGLPEIDEVDAWLMLDGPIHPSGKQQIVFGARGVLSLDLTVFGPTRTLHSGHYGNFVPNPAMRLVHLLASMREANGLAKVEGFRDANIQFTDLEKRAIAELPHTDHEFLNEVGIHNPEDGVSGLLESISRPAINLHGISAGHVQREATNAIMQQADASLDIRLVPGQTFEGTTAAFERHIRTQGFHIVHESPSRNELLAHEMVVQVRWGDGYGAWRTGLDSQFAHALISSAKSFETDVVINPMIGGSVPIAKIAERSGKPVAILPIANHDNNQHGANENIRVGNLIRGVALYATVLSSLHWDTC